jgi:hypothetical protein
MYGNLKTGTKLMYLGPSHIAIGIVRWIEDGQMEVQWTGDSIQDSINRQYEVKSASLWRGVAIICKDAA